jgi:putative ABC transport system substrate-binding protein
LSLPLQAVAQDILASIITADLPRYRIAHDAMVTVLKAGGFGEDKLKIFVQSPNADTMSLANSLRRSEAAGVALVVTFGGRATAVAQQELKKTPLLFADVYDPVAQGTVKTLTATGTDATGATSKTDLGQLVAAVLKLKTVAKIGVIYTQGEPGSEQQLAEVQSLAGPSGFSVLAENARNPKEAVELADKLAATCDALYLTESIAATQEAASIIATVQANQCPVFSQIPGLVAAGALIGLEADPEEQGKLVAVHVLQILQGQKAHILPVRPAKKVTLKISKKAAATLGLAIPGEIAAGAQLLD